MSKKRTNPIRSDGPSERQTDDAEKSSRCIMDQCAPGQEAVEKLPGKRGCWIGEPKTHKTEQ